MRIDVVHFAKSWDESKKANPCELNLPHGKLSVSVMLHTWSLDFAGLVEETDVGGRYILLAIESLSNSPVASVIIPDIFNSIGVINFVREHIRV